MEGNQFVTRDGQVVKAGTFDEQATKIERDAFQDAVDAAGNELDTTMFKGKPA